MHSPLPRMPARTEQNFMQSGLRGLGAFATEGTSTGSAAKRHMLIYGFAVLGLSQVLMYVQLQQNSRRNKEKVSALGGTVAMMEEELKTVNGYVKELKEELVKISEGGKAMKQDLGSITQEFDAVDAKLDALLAKWR